MTTHSFQESLITSEQTTIPDSLYYKIFGEGITIKVCARDTTEQTEDRIDKVITLPGGKVIKVEEKLRLKDYNDLLIEETSCVETGSPGWIVKPSMADYLVYYVVPSHQAHIYRMADIQSEWQSRQDDLKVIGTKRIACSSTMYHTLNWSLPYRSIKSKCFVVTI